MDCRLLAVLVGAVLVASCTSSGAPSAVNPPSDDPAQALRDAQTALERAGGYTLTVEQENFMLPQWGGSDGGTVRVAADGSVATAELWRTGDGAYSLMYVGGQTYFRRATCQTWARVPGGGKDVLRPFLFPQTRALADATNVAKAGPFIRGTLEGVGEASVSLNPNNARPVELIAASEPGGTGRLKWTFGRWGEGPSAAVPDTGGVERGPGGNPC